MKSFKGFLPRTGHSSCSRTPSALVAQCSPLKGLINDLRVELHKNTVQTTHVLRVRVRVLFLDRNSAMSANMPASITYCVCTRARGPLREPVCE